MSLPAYRFWFVLFGLAASLAAWRVLGQNRLGPTLTYAIGAGLAALAGVLAAPIINANVYMGAPVINKVFAVLIVAGTGSIPGVIIVALLLGMIDVLASAYFSPVASFSPLIAMVIVLALRPSGLFGDIETRRNIVLAPLFAVRCGRRAPSWRR